MYRADFGSDWLDDKIRCKFAFPGICWEQSFIPAQAWQAVDGTSNIIEAIHKDVLIDLVGYRRWGHNEGDEPAFTQPTMYDFIRSHPTVREIYARKLEQEGVVSAQEAEQMVQEVTQKLSEARNEADRGLYPVAQGEHQELNGHHVKQALPASVSAERLHHYNDELLNWPQGFAPHPKLARLLQRRANTLGEDGGIDRYHGPDWMLW